MVGSIGMIFYMLLWIAIVAFLLTMLYRFVRAVERIAEKIEYCFPTKQEYDK